MIRLGNRWVRKELVMMVAIVETTHPTMLAMTGECFVQLLAIDGAPLAEWFFPTFAEADMEAQRIARAIGGADV